MIRYADEAYADLQEIDLYLGPRAGVSITNHVLEAILDRIDWLERFPLGGRPGRHPGTRELVISRYPYVVIYRLVGQDVEIARILHTARQWPQAKNR